MSFHVRQHKLTSGTVTFRIRYWDGDKHKTVPPNEHPQFKNLKEAEAFCKQQNAKKDADRHLERHAKGLNALEFDKQFVHFKQEVELFLDWYKDEAPNSWEACRCWLENYVVPYFLGKGLNNPNLWHREFETFRKWLEKSATSIKNEKKLSYATKNHIIKALNCYLRYLGLHNKMDVLTSKVICRGFKRNLTNRRGADDLIQPAEYKSLLKNLDSSREFFIVLMNTGMRIHELYSLQFSNVFKGEKDLDATLRMPYKQMGQTIYGYVRLESQMKLKWAYRSKNGTIARKPLKSKPRISPEYNRVIPITDPETWDILVENRRRAMQEWENKIHASTKADDYLLFNVDLNEIRRDMRKHTKKTAHCCRHTFTTNTVRSFRGVNYGPELIKGITGHTSAEFERYVHLSMEDENEAKKLRIEKF
jgi:integrase